MTDREPLILVGSSVRSAAQSAFRAGFSPWCIDQFGDRDLREVATEVRTVADWPIGIESVFADAPNAGWVYTGAIENSRELVERLSCQRPLWGCGSDVLSLLRNPVWVAQTLEQASLPSLPVIVPAAAFDEMVSGCDLSIAAMRSGQWMRKPLASAAGINVRDFDGDRPDPGSSNRHFLQKKANGRSVSGLYLGAAGSVRLLGMCEQLCRGPDAGTCRYIYSGSLGPLSTSDVPQRAFEQAQQIGSAIASGLSTEGSLIAGLFGIDFILDEVSSELWTLEVNPRYPASAELYERAFGWHLMKWHVDACRNCAMPPAFSAGESSVGNRRYKHGKQILYARQDFEVPDIIPLVEQLPGSDVERISVADIPHPGTLIRKDEPVCTILTAQETLAGCREVLMSNSAALLTAVEAAGN